MKYSIQLKNYKKYEANNFIKPIFEVVISFMLYAMTYLPIYFYPSSISITGLCCLANGIMLVKLFTIQHDCTHGSFFSHVIMNNLIGRIISFFTLTPFSLWKWQHLIHHRTNGNLDTRGIGDVTILTIDQYKNLSRFKKILYRIKRNTVVFFLFLSPLYFIFLFRIIHFFYRSRSDFKKSIKYSVILTNIALFILYPPFVYFLGKQYILFFFFSFWISSIIGVWLFYIQHIFPFAYLRPSNQWNFYESALKGSSFYKLPGILDWCTSSIGYHHIHHLYPKIPGYHLKKFFNENKTLQDVTTFNLLEGFSVMRLKLFNPHTQTMIGWKEFDALF